MLIPDYVRFVTERLKNSGYEAFLVGGCVRDGIMGKPPKDYDITSNAPPEQILACFSDCRTLDNGIKHGTVCVVFGKECVEITTYRVDGEYTDCRHPDSVTFSQSLRDDLSRRDFAMNAVAFDETTGYIDPFGGADDIKRKVIRCVGVPSLRFSEDALRIMRALRFSAVLGFDIEKNTAQAAFKCAELLSKVSAERIYSELVKLVCGKNASAVVYKYGEIIRHALGAAEELEELDEKGFFRASEVLRALDLSNDDISLALAAFFCAFGKGEKDVLPCVKILSRLKVPTAVKQTVEILCRYADFDFSADRICARKLAGKIGFENTFRVLSLAAAKHPDKAAACAELSKITKDVLNDGDCIRISDLAVNGKDLISAGIKRGKAIGDILERLLCDVVEQRADNNAAVLLERAKIYYKRSSKEIG